MGRNTFDSLQMKDGLPKRHNIIVSSTLYDELHKKHVAQLAEGIQPEYSEITWDIFESMLCKIVDKETTIIVVKSVDCAMQICTEFKQYSTNDTYFIGGPSIIKEGLRFATVIYETEIYSLIVPVNIDNDTEKTVYCNLTKDPNFFSTWREIERISFLNCLHEKDPKKMPYRRLTYARIST
jgi:hypothetical protein